MVFLGGGCFLMSEVPLYILTPNPKRSNQALGPAISGADFMSEWKKESISHPTRCRANAAHIRQSGPDAGRGFKVKVLETFEGVARRRRLRADQREGHPWAVPLHLQAQAIYRPLNPNKPSNQALGPAISGADFMSGWKKESILHPPRCRANTAHTRQSMPEYGT